MFDCEESDTLEASDSLEELLDFEDVLNPCPPLGENRDGCLEDRTSPPPSGDSRSPCDGSVLLVVEADIDVAAAAVAVVVVVVDLSIAVPVPFPFRSSLGTAVSRGGSVFT